MALQLRRGPTSQLTSITPAQGELIYVTDYASHNVSPLYVGDGVTAGGNPAGVYNVNGFTGAVALTTNVIPEGGGGGNNEYFTATRASDAVGAMLAAGTLSGLTISYNSSTHAITITNPSVINTGTANSLAYWAANGTALSPSASITWNESGNNLNITNGNYSSINNYSGAQISTFSTYASNSASNSFTFRRARGTNVTPTVSVVNDQIQSINFQAYDGTNFVTASQITSNIANTIGSGIVPGDVRLFTADPSTGVLYPRLTSNYNGVTIGPSTSADLGSGSLYIHQTVSSSTASTAQVNNYYTDANGAGISLRKYRGTYASPTVVLQNDLLGSISARGFDGTSSTLAGRMDIFADSTISTGVVPGAIQFSTANSSGAMTLALKIDHTQVSTFSSNVVVNGNLTVNGTTVTVNSTTVNIEDKVVVLGTVSSPTDTTASGGGISLSGTTTKSILWTSTGSTGGTNTGYWNHTDNVNLGGSSLSYYINNVSVLSASTVLANASTVNAYGSATTINEGAAGVELYLGANTGNSTLSILGNGTTGTATITTNVTSGTANLFVGVTGNIYIGNSAGTLNINGTASVGGSLLFSSATVAAAGTGQSTGTAITADNNFVTSGTGGVTLPAATVGREISITNDTANSIVVYPATGHFIESLSANVGVTVPAYATLGLIAKAGNNWWTSQPVYNAGTNLSITQSANGSVTWATVASPSFTNVTRTGLEITPANYITVSSTSTYVLSSTVTDNILLVSNTGYTATLTFPSSGLVDGQRLRISVQTNTVTLALTAGPTLSGTFAGSVTAPTTFIYIYRLSNTTWYRIQ